MTFVSTVRLSHENLVLVPTSTAVPDATIRYEYAVRSVESAQYFVSVFGDGRTAVEDAMEADQTVAEWLRVAAFRGRSVYRITPGTGPELVPPRIVARGVFVHQVRNEGDGWRIRVHVPNQALLSSILQYYRDAGVSVRLTHLYESTDDDAEPYFLTDGQREILTLAYHEGYFDVPRRFTQEDLADCLDVSTSAVSQRLRRALFAVLTVTLDERPPIDR